MSSKISLEKFKEIANTLPLTKPQRKIMERLNDGYTMGWNNEHHKSGGCIVWVHPETKQPEYAGHIYRAHANLRYKVEKHLGVRHMSVKGLFTHSFKEPYL